jgi:hypothetical protein
MAGLKSKLWIRLHKVMRLAAAGQSPPILLDAGPRAGIMKEDERPARLSVFLQSEGANQDRPDVRSDWWRAEVGQQAS